MKIRTLLVDDEALGRKRLRKLLETETDYELIGECCDGQEAVAAIQAFTPDLLFLDVQMPELNGFEVLAQLDHKRLPVIIFVTAYDQYALKAFEAQAIDYLLKPFEDERFYQSLHRARAYIAGQQSNQVSARLETLISGMSLRPKPMTRMAVKTSGRVVFVKTSEIDWIEAVGNYLNLHIGTETHMLRGRISEDGGRTWDASSELILRDDLPNRNLGYPSSVLVEPGRVFTAYYGEDAHGVTCIQGCAFSV